MELVFIHGWGFDASFWDTLAVLLPQMESHRLDLGFFGAPTDLSMVPPAARILVGHSLGFVHGLQLDQEWEGWIAINSFPRFVTADGKPGCVPEAELRDIGLRLQKDPAKTLRDFYAFIGGKGPDGAPDAGQLRAGLEELSGSDVSGMLAKLKIPGLALASRNDPLVPEPASEELGLLAQGGGILWHESGGHVLPQTDPGWCADAVTNFLRKHF